MGFQTTLLPLCVGLGIACGTMAVLWLVQRRTGNAGIVDVAWSGLVGVLGALYAVWAPGPVWLRVVVGLMIAVWSLRLTIYLFRRVVGHPEEGRYVSLREAWGEAADRKFFRFFQAQALAAWCFALPVIVVTRSSTPPATWLVVAAITLWAIGISGVSLSDRQLAAFKSNPDNRGQTCRDGLWRYSRHPNYFFEWLHWCAYVPLSAGSPLWWISASVAALLLVSVLFVTGIPPTEAQAIASRGDDYRRYQRTTNAFFPWFPKQLADEPC
ncbi:MAG: DUF1295 domain-containing protein [Planctomycetota bacterium]